MLQLQREFCRFVLLDLEGHQSEIGVVVGLVRRRGIDEVDGNWVPGMDQLCPLGRVLVRIKVPPVPLSLAALV